MTIKFCLIVKTVPEWNNKHKNLYTCSIGFSPELGLIRVYPLPITGMRSGYVYEIEVEKRKIDSRKSSYELVGIKNNRLFFNEVGVFKMSDIGKYLLRYRHCSIDDLNKNRESIGIIPIERYRIYWDVQDRYINTSQIGLFEDVQVADFVKFTKEARQKEARILFYDADGKHDLQYNDWSVTEYARKFQFDNNAFRFIENKNHILVGNMLQYQSSWMALKAISIEQNSLTLF